MNDELQAQAAAALPVTVLTGFLGSGKTTLLSRLLAHPGMGETAVLVNELGEVGLDHLLVREVAEDVVLLNSGCLCCNVRGDLIDAMRGMFLRRVRGEIPHFRRLVIETTGLADPAPILHTLMTDPLIGARYRFDGIVTTVDAVHGAATLDRHPESVKQVAVADRLLLTKVDLVSPESVARLAERLRELNPAAPQIEACHGDVEPAKVLGAGLFDPSRKHPDVAAWLRADAYGHTHDHDHDHRHGETVDSFVITLDQPVAWDALAQALDLLTATRGESLLRIKGIVNAREIERPIIVHGVQHMFHPPVTLPAWPDGDRRTRLVFITRGLGRGAVADLLRALIGDA